MVDFLEKGLTHHVAEELGCQKDNADTATRLERAFLMADIHSHQAGVESSGATVALCLVKVSFVPYIREYVTAQSDSVQAGEDNNARNALTNQLVFAFRSDRR
jgi:hypothetical protein